ncbi:hypothetical protein E2C01_028677 [Portunus trituberculatus]|uniref:Uncharacterized protein n=1 Tax=Portunus trituberculatus TaxID=210409 RepID=A0A5B7EPN5_PORTR|nr:hypothetical protein [Portunus trituberculatus]
MTGPRRARPGTPRVQSTDPLQKTRQTRSDIASLPIDLSGDVWVLGASLSPHWNFTHDSSCCVCRKPQGICGSRDAALALSLRSVWSSHTASSSASSSSFCVTSLPPYLPSSRLACLSACLPAPRLFRSLDIPVLIS